jgi:hypothetical protein
MLEVGAETSRLLGYVAREPGNHQKE